MLATETALKDKAMGQKFDKMFREHYLMMHRVAYSVTRCPHDAEDVVQTVFARLLGGNCPVELVRWPKSYLCEAAMRGAMNVVRSRERRNVKSDADVEYLESPPLKAGASQDDGLDPEFQKILGTLKPKVALMVVLRYVEEYSNERIATLLQIPQPLVALTLFRARRKLQKAMRPSGGRR